MNLKVCFVGVFLTLVCCWSLTADDSGQKLDTVDQPTPPTGQRFDREKLKQLRERLGNEKLDASKLKRMTWKVGDTNREALVYLPASPVTKTPLVFVFHGHGGRPEHPARKLAIHESWPEAVCVYPQGIPTPIPLLDPDGKMAGWQTAVGNQQDRDLQFFDTMLKSMTTDHSIDEKRVYATGHSNGGNFTYVLWAARGDTFAAVAPIATIHDLKDFKLQKPKPVLHIAGEKDPIVKFRLQEWTMTQIRSLNGCNSEGKPAGDFCTEYTSPNGSPVVTLIHPGGHEIPEGAAKRVVEFFKEHPKESK